MNFTQSFKLALKSLRTSKMRSFLTMLGIIIGVGAVIIIISLGNGLKSMVDQQVERVGITQIYTYTWGLGDGTTGNVSPEEMYAVVESRPDLFEGITPWVGAGQGIRIGGEEYKKTGIYGVSEAMYRPATGTTLDGGALARGRYLQYVDVATQRKVCVVGAYVEQNLLGGDALGKTVSIQGVPYTVVGVLAQNSETMTEGGGDDQIYIPYPNAMQISGTSYVSLYQITAVSRDAVSQAQAVLMDFLRDFYHDTDGSLVYNAYYVQTMLEQVELINTMMGVAMMVLVAIAAISLLVGGIGIMNIMLVSVTERTREIGIRKSLGAKERYIMQQFVIEAAATSALGGIIGILFGDGLSAVATTVIARISEESITVAPTLGAVALAFGISVGIGILFGYLPAKKAARLNPIDALHYD